MIDRIISFSINNKLIVGLFIAGLIGWGAYAAIHLPIDAVPDITDNQVQVITNAPTLAAQEVEQLITYPLELSLGNVPGVLEIRSVSRFGLSVITVVFKESVDIYLARQLISERIKEAESDIPSDIGKPTMSPISTGLGEVYQYVIYPKDGFEETYDPIALRTIQDWIVKRQLIGVEGVIEVNSSGGYLKQYEVALDPNKLKSINLSIVEVYEAIAKNNANAGGSYIEKEQYTYFIRGEGRLKGMKDIEQVVVKHHPGEIPIKVKDIAKVKIGHAPRFGAVTMNGKGEVVAGQVMMLKGANAAEVTKRVKDRMAQIKKALPEGLEIEPYLDRSKLVNRTIKTVRTNLLEGGLIVIFILVLLMGSFRAGLIVASVIPLSLLFAIAMMRVFGVSANLMSLGAIDFGLIVDGAVIIVEAILHHLRVHRKGERLSIDQMNQEVQRAASKIRKSAAFGEVIILIVYLPILFLSGIEGKMFRPMAQTVGFAIIGALILSLTYVPMMAALFLNKQINDKITLSDRIVLFLQGIYEPALKAALKLKWLLLSLTLLLFVVSLGVFARMGGEFIPTLEEGDFALHQILPSGSSIAQGVTVSAELQNILMDKFPEVEKVVTKIGTAEIPTDIMPLEAGDIYVILKPKEQWTSASTKEELFEKMEYELNQFPGVIYEFTQPIQMRFNELMTGVRQDIAIKIYGEDLGLLVKYANEAKQIIEQINGVGDIQVEPTAGLQQMVARYDLTKMARYGVNAAMVNETIRAAFAGASTGYIYEGERRFELVVRLDEPFRQQIQDIRNLYIPIHTGEQIPLSEIATVQMEEGPTQISRDNTQRRITIGVNARGRDVESLVQSIQNRLDTKLDLDPGYYLTYGGQFENLQNARASLYVAVPIALLLIFILLYLTFHSVGQATLIFTAIPMSAIGGIWALYIRGMPFSISAGVGFVALFGVAVLNGIVLIAYFNHLKQEGMKDVKKRILEGTKVRLRPVMMTAAVASLGFLPMAFSNSAGAEVQRPLATVVIGGLVTATLLTLFVLPILYYLFEQYELKWRKKIMLMGGICLLFGVLNGQSSTIDLSEAINRARTNSILLKPYELTIDAQKELLGIKGLHPNGNLFWSGDEVGFNNQSGIQAVNLTQNFNLPKVGKAQNAYQDAQYQLAKTQLEVQSWQLDYWVSLAYYALAYQKHKRYLLEKQIAQYQQLLQIAEQRVESGVGTRLSVVAVETKAKYLGLLKDQNLQDIAITSTNLSRLIQSEMIVDIPEDSLEVPSQKYSFPQKHFPQLTLAEQKVTVAEQFSETQKAQLLPKINTGLQAQSINGAIPFWGYQLGLTLPLFKSFQKKKLESSKVQEEVQKANQELVLFQIERTNEINLKRLDQKWNSIQFSQKQLLPLLENQYRLSENAWRQGELGYLAWITTLDQFFNAQLELVDLLWEYYQLQISLEFGRP